MIHITHWVCNKTNNWKLVISKVKLDCIIGTLFLSLWSLFDVIRILTRIHSDLIHKWNNSKNNNRQYWFEICIWNAQCVTKLCTLRWIRMTKRNCSISLCYHSSFFSLRFFSLSEKVLNQTNTRSLWERKKSFIGFKSKEECYLVNWCHSCLYIVCTVQHIGKKTNREMGKKL